MTLAAADIQKLYVAYFNRPADPGGLVYWQNGSSLVNVATQFAASAEYTGIYAGMVADEIVDAIYQNLFGRHVESAQSLAYWSVPLKSGQTTLAGIVTEIAAGAQGADKAALDAKVSGAGSFTNALDLPQESLAYQGGAVMAGAKQWLSHITDAATLAGALSTLDAAVATVLLGRPVPSAPIYFSLQTLTAAKDNFVGGDYRDLFQGSSATVGVGDSIDGGAGIDTLALSLSGAASGLTMKNVETLLLDAGNATATLDLAGVSGLASLSNTSSGASVSVNNLANLVALTLSGTGITTINYVPGIVAGPNDAMTLTLAGADGGVFTTAGVETLTVTAVARGFTTAVPGGPDTAMPFYVYQAPNVLTTLNDTGLIKLVLAGTGPLSFTNPVGGATLTTVDATAAVAVSLTTGDGPSGGGITVLAPRAGDLTITTGSGNDNVTLTAGNFNNITTGAGNDIVTASAFSHNAIDLGAGNDIVILNGAADIVTLGAGFDQVRITHTSAFPYDTALPGGAPSLITDFLVGASLNATDLLGVASGGSGFNGAALAAGSGGAGSLTIASAGTLILQMLGTSGTAAASAANTEIVKLTSIGAGTGSNVQEIFNHAIGSASYTGVRDNTEHLVLVYDATNGRALILDVNSHAGTGTAIAAGDSVQVLGMLTMTAADYANFGTTHIFTF